MFYQYTFSRAAKYITDKDLAYFSSVVEKIEKSVGYEDFDIYVQGAIDFGHKVLQIARNPIIEKSVTELTPTAERILFTAYEIDPSFIEKAFNHVQESYHCLSNKDSENAAKFFSRFANVSREILVKHFKNDDMSIN